MEGTGKHDEEGEGQVKEYYMHTTLFTTATVSMYTCSKKGRINVCVN
jgi:hypothetical protein